MKSWLFSAVIIFEGPALCLLAFLRMMQTHSSNDISIPSWGFAVISAGLWALVARKDKSKTLELACWLWAFSDLFILIAAIFLRLNTAKV